MIERKYDDRYRLMRPAGPEPSPPEPLRTYKPRRALRNANQGGGERGRSARDPP
jgi:hypothetical protein